MVGALRAVAEFFPSFLGLLLMGVGGFFASGAVIARSLGTPLLQPRLHE